jgi:hypothetical protein
MTSEANPSDVAKSGAEDKICAILNDLTGEPPRFPKKLGANVQKLLEGSGIGYSQFNELLLLLGYDRVSASFFRFLVDGHTDYEGGEGLGSLEALRSGVERFRELALLNFGNIKYGFKYLSATSTDLTSELARVGPVNLEEFKRRHDPLLPVDPIPGDKTYYLGYIVELQLQERLKRDANDKEAAQQLEERRMIVEKAKRNHEAYLTSDHMDVYVATSMRERHEYQMVHEVVSQVSSNENLHGLKIRWFDPTQAYCADRIDKGLAEGLMLKRASCTLYLAQESDTLGKDSELASTLAQGKPVVAFIPGVTEENQDQYVEHLLQMVALGFPSAKEQTLILQQLKVFSPEAAWSDKDVVGWVADAASMNLTLAKKKLGDAIRKHYDKRAQTLKEAHPLGIQVHLETGVANGVLVARTIEECANLIRRILTRTLQFRITDKYVGGDRYLLLRESTTGSVFRVMTGDRFLTNAFWNFYLS